MKRTLLLATLLVVPTLLGGAERIILRDGNTLDGNIRSQNRAVIVIDTKAGRQTIQKATVTRVVFGLPDPEDEEKKRLAELAKKDRERLESQKAKLEDEAAKQEMAMRASITRVEDWDKKIREDSDAKAQEAMNKTKADEATTGEKGARTAEASSTEKKDAGTGETPPADQKGDAASSSTTARSAGTADASAEKKDTANVTQPAGDKTPGGAAGGSADSGTSPLMAAMYSLILPGWGQYDTGRPIMGSLYLGLFAGAIYGAYNENRMYVAARKEYEQYKNPYNTDAMLVTFTGLTAAPTEENLYITSQDYAAKRGAVEKHFRARNQFAGGILLIALISAADAFFFTDSPTALKVELRSNEIGFFLSPVPAMSVQSRKPDNGITAGLVLSF